MVVSRKRVEDRGQGTFTFLELHIYWASHILIPGLHSRPTESESLRMKSDICILNNLLKEFFSLRTKKNKK